MQKKTIVFRNPEWWKCDGQVGTKDPSNEAVLYSGGSFARTCPAQPMLRILVNNEGVWLMVKIKHQLQSKDY